MEIFIAAILFGRSSGGILMMRQVGSAILCLVILFLIAPGFLALWGGAANAVVGLFLSGLAIGSLYPLSLSFVVRMAETARAAAALRLPPHRLRSGHRPIDSDARARTRSRRSSPSLFPPCFILERTMERQDAVSSSWWTGADEAGIAKSVRGRRRSAKPMLRIRGGRFVKR